MLPAIKEQVAKEQSCAVSGRGFGACVAATLGIRAVSEIYADRGYTEEGRLIPRGKAGALIEDPNEAAARVLAMVEAGGIVTASGTLLKTPVALVCTHGDSPRAIEIARRVRARLEAADIRVAAFVAP